MGKDKTRGDYQAVAFVGRSKGKVYADVKLMRVAPPQLVDMAISWWQVLKPSAFVCETHGFQELLGGMIIQKTQELGVFDCICQSHVATGNKEIRIERDLTPLLARGLLKIRKDSPDTRKLYDQMRAFPNADHDDGPDALALAISTLRDMINGKERVIGRMG
jgi:predicted phage terminase large subunit-like protein